MAEELTPEQRRLLESLAETARKDLAEGRSREEIVKSLVGRGLSTAAAERIVADAKAPSPQPTAATPMRELFVVNLPPEADPSELVGAPPLGQRSEVATAIMGAFEGLRLNSEGRGRFERPGCVIDVDTGPDDLVSLVTLGVQGGEVAQHAVKTLSQKTGWRVIDRSADKLFDMPGGTVPTEPLKPRPKPKPAGAPSASSAPKTSKVAAPAAASKPTKSGRGTGQTMRLHKDQISGAGRSPRRMAFAVLGIVLLAAAVFVGVQTQLASSSSEVNEALALVEVLEFARAQNVFGTANLGAYAPPEVLADPSRYASVLNIGAPLETLGGGRFAEDVRHGYRFEFRPDPGSARHDAPVTPAFDGFTYVAVPVTVGKSGQRSFAYFSRPNRTIVAREDGQVPTRRDTPVARLP